MNRYQRIISMNLEELAQTIIDETNISHYCQSDCDYSECPPEGELKCAVKWLRECEEDE